MTHKMSTTDCSGEVGIEYAAGWGRHFYRSKTPFVIGYIGRYDTLNPVRGVGPGVVEANIDPQWHRSGGPVKIHRKFIFFNDDASVDNNRIIESIDGEYRTGR